MDKINAKGKEHKRGKRGSGMLLTSFEVIHPRQVNYTSNNLTSFFQLSSDSSHWIIVRG